MKQIVEETQKADFTLNSRPYAPPEVFSKELGAGTWVLIDPEMPNWIAVDFIGKDIVDLCDGERSLRKVTETLCAKYDSDLNSSKDSIVEFVNMLAEKEFLSAEPFLYPSVDKRKIQGMHTLWLNVTYRCNLHCLHCFRAAGEVQENELTSQEIYGVIDEFESLGGRELVFSGGEPLLRDDILDILHYANKKSIKSVKLITNGTLITSKIAKALKEIEPIYVQVSIDGATKKTADKVRGKNAFQKAVAGVKHLAEGGLAQDLVLSMTLMNTNLEELEKFIELAIDLGATGVHFPLFQPVGRGKKNQDQLTPDVESLHVALKRILNARERYSKRITFSLSPEIIKYVRGLRRDYCGAGIGIWSMEPDGSITPCAGLYDSQFIAGSIREQTLKEIVLKSPVARRFQALHVIDNPNCASCELRFMCGGGCHVDRFAKHGELESPWPKCETTKLIYYEYIKRLIHSENAG